MDHAAALDAPFRPFEALRAARRLMQDPNDTRQVFKVIAALRGRSGQKLFQRFAGCPTGQAVLVDRRQLLDRLQDQDALARLPEGSLGRAYLAFMQEEDLSADGLVEASEAGGVQSLPPDARLFRERMRDMHDLNHVLTGYGRDPLGELCLLAFMYRQTGNRGGALIALMGMSKFPKGPAGRPACKALFEAFRNGGRSAWLPGLDWEALLSENLKSLRRRLSVPAPEAYQRANRRPETPTAG
jgi:ubiquinone biosynthesis protein COQ4